MIVKYSGYLSSFSGMGEAARNYVRACYEAGIDVSTEFVPNLTSSDHLGKAYEICKERENKNIPYTVKIIHTTPDVVQQHMEPMKYHIFHLFWETDKLPTWWVWALNHSVDEIWTGSEWNKEIFQRSGVRIPIWVCPQPIDTLEKNYTPFTIPGHQGFLFASVFQWIERKDPKALLTAYWKEFQHGEKVGLLLKTYKESFLPKETESIVQEIKQWKRELGLPHYPKVYLFPESMGRKEADSPWS